MQHKVRSATEVKELLGIDYDITLDATGNVNYFNTGSCYYNYTAIGFIGWVVYVNATQA